MSKNQTLKKSKKMKLATKALITKNIFLKASKSKMLFLKKTTISFKKTTAANAK